MFEQVSVLVVDDFSTMRKIIRTLLVDIGFQKIQEADNGAAALALLEARPFDLLITDWNMPKMDGYELLCQVRQNPKLSHLPVLMVTSESTRDNLIRAAKAGVNGYIIKPFTADVLKQKLEHIYTRLAAAPPRRDRAERG